MNDIRQTNSLEEVAEWLRGGLLALEKLSHSAEEIERRRKDLNEDGQTFESRFNGMMLKDVVFTLVNEYGWTYEDADRYVEKWGMVKDTVKGRST